MTTRAEHRRAAAVPGAVVDSPFRGKRVSVLRTLPHVRNGIPHPGFGQALQLSCGHTIPKAGWVWSSGDPVWCEECTGATCRACGARATVCRSPSYEWGEACVACTALPEDVWVWRVEQHYLDTMTTTQHVKHARDYWRSAQKTERQAADPKREYYPPVHTREGEGEFAMRLFVDSLVHVLYLFVWERST